MEYLTALQLINVHETKKETNQSIFSIEPLLPGYGVTIGNALRRILLSSLPGAAITTIKIDGVTHEFTTIEGVKEDLVDIILNLKGVRFTMDQAEPVTVKLLVNGPKTVVAGDFKKVANLAVMNPDHYLATVDKKKTIAIEAVVEKGVGYLPTERRKDQKLPVGMIAIDSIFTPIIRVNISTENTRVGQMTNYDKLYIDVTTDGTVEPTKAIQYSCDILTSHFAKFSSLLSSNNQKPIKKTRKKSS